MSWLKPLSGGASRSVQAGRTELLNAHWHRLRAVPSSRPCPGCGAEVRADDHTVYHGGELYHPDCALFGRGRA